MSGKNEKVSFEHKRLRDYIRTRAGGETDFAKKLGMTSAMLARKLDGRVDFTVTEMHLCVELLHLNLYETSVCFFAPAEKTGSDKERGLTG